jgi:hypothetical protein
VQVRGPGLPLEDAGALELDVLWTAFLEEAAPLAEENPDKMELELVEDVGDIPRRLPGAPAVYAAARTTRQRLSLTAAPMSRASVGRGRCILLVAGGPVDLDRYPLRGGSRVDQVKRGVRAGVGE